MEIGFVDGAEGDGGEVDRRYGLSVSVHPLSAEEHIADHSLDVGQGTVAVLDGVLADVRPLS